MLSCVVTSVPHPVHGTNCIKSQLFIQRDPQWCQSDLCVIRNQLLAKLKALHWPRTRTAFLWIGSPCKSRGFRSEQCSVAVRPEALLTDYECVTQLVCQLHQLLPHQLLCAQTERPSPPHHWQGKKQNCVILRTYVQAGLILFLDVMSDVCMRDLLLMSLTGIPSIFALMSFLLFLMAERTASNRNPGHLSSLRISLHKHIHLDFFTTVHQHTYTNFKCSQPTSDSSWAPPAPGTGWSWARFSRKWCHAPPSWWSMADQDPSGHLLTFSLTCEVSDLDWTDGGTTSCQLQTRKTQIVAYRVRIFESNCSGTWIKGSIYMMNPVWAACIQGCCCWFCPVVLADFLFLCVSPSGQPPCRPSSPQCSLAGPAEHSACVAAPHSSSWSAPTVPGAVGIHTYTGTWYCNYSF